MATAMRALSIQPVVQKFSKANSDVLQIVAQGWITAKASNSMGSLNPYETDFKQINVQLFF